MTTIGERLRQARLDAGYHDEAAFSDRLGITRATLQAWEANLQRPGDDQLECFAEITGADATSLSHLAHREAPQGICSAVDLIPDRGQAEVLEQVGIPPQLWASEDTWVAFLRITRAAADLSAEEISLLAEHSEACITDANNV